MSQTEGRLRLAHESKLTSHHCERLVVVCARQSSSHQVQHHHESAQLQYGFVAPASTSRRAASS